MEFPHHADLLPHLTMEAAAQRVAEAEVAAQEEIAPGYRAGYTMLGRFNLRVVDLALAADDPGAHAGVVHVRSDFDHTASVYLRNTFLPLRFYHAPTLGRGDTWVFVLENKVLGGRDARHDDDAQSRPLVVCFFERAESAADELVVRRTERQFAGMTPLALTPAELALHLGFALPVDDERPALESEALVERAWLGIPRLCYEHRQLTEAADIHTYLLSQPMGAEDVFWSKMPVQGHTKYAIARHLERSHGWDRERFWRRSLAELQQPGGGRDFGRGAVPPRRRGKGGGAGR